VPYYNQGPLRDFQFHTFKNKDAIDLPWQQKIDTPSAIALMEWNSRVGVPGDVWSVVSTGVVLCGECDIVRTISAHNDHLGEGGACTDPGQDFIAPSGDDSDNSDNSV
jgi:hypothetical protein